MTTIAVCLAVGVGFGATSTWTVPLPCPDEGSMCATQVASAEAVHTHSRVVVSVTSRLPPAGLMGDCGLTSVRAHLSTAVGPVEVTSVDPHAESNAVHAAMSSNSSVRRVEFQAVPFKTMSRLPAHLPRRDSSSNWQAFRRNPESRGDLPQCPLHGADVFGSHPEELLLRGGQPVQARVREAVERST